ncbi:alpha/beta hydrolase family protein [Euzebya tangerina]|uniref:alpha/beta hydrolase family protein n=1 Tax=Euzebya tangerina TaxID=591198 RepID=UPI000E30EAEF|nr:alpha/beta hydrolase [Euzebya tangerina]
MIANERPARLEPTEITIDGPAGQLSGTLVHAADGVARPVVLLISGSGPIDRNSDSKKLAIGVMGRLARCLRDAGVASLRYDKRGVGASSGAFLTTGFHDNVGDATAVLDALRSRDDVDPSRVVVIGHSEGALIAAELAAANPDLAGVVLLSGAAVTGEEVLRWQAGQVGATLPKPVKLMLRLLRVDILRSQAKRLAQLKATTEDTTRIQLAKVNAKWFREFMAHDPLEALRATTVPVLALTGSKDIQVDPVDVERMAQVVTAAYTGEILDDVTHLLRTEEGPPSLRTYKKQAKQPLAPAVLRRTTDWVLAHTREKTG